MFTNITDQTVNVTAAPRTAAGNKRKCGENSSANKPNKRAAVSTSTTANQDTRTSADKNTSHSVPAVFGVGPISASATTERASHSAFEKYGSLREAGPGRSTTNASDVWACVRGLKSRDIPATLPAVDQIIFTRPDHNEFSHLGCRFCK